MRLTVLCLSLMLASCSQNRNDIALVDHVPVVVTAGLYAGCTGVILTGDETGLIVDTVCERNSQVYRFVRKFQFNELQEE